VSKSAPDPGSPVLVPREFCETEPALSGVEGAGILTLKYSVLCKSCEKGGTLGMN